MSKTNILLDLDNTLISSVDEEEEKMIGKQKMSRLFQTFEWRNMENLYKIFARPHLQEFLTWLFTHFNVSVWTAASSRYALFIISEFILAGHPERVLDYIFFSNYCRKSLRVSSHQKCLKLLATDVGYDLDNTYIIDDLQEVYDSQPSKCVRVKPFYASSRNAERDTELIKAMKKMDLLFMSE